MRKICFFFLFSISLSLQSQDTVLKLYRPFNQISAQAPITILKKIQGQCLHPSEHTSRKDSWRCEADGKIYDPCFSAQAGSPPRMICPNAPETGLSIEILLTSSPDNASHEELDMSRNYPWTIELDHGILCQSMQTQESYDHLPIRYHCNDQSLLIGSIQRCDPQWKMLNLKGHQISTVMIKQVWF